MTSSIAAIKIAQKQLGLDDETYRAKLRLITGKTSTKDMTEAERQKVITVFRNEGFTPSSPRRQNGRHALSGKYAKKLQAMWIAAWNLGIVDNRDDAALEAFVERQTGLARERWLHQAEDARKVVEALKGWMEREAAVNWGTTRRIWQQADGARIAWAQWRILNPAAVLVVMMGFDREVFRVTGATALEEVSARGWIDVMNVLGRQVRATKEAAREGSS